MQEFFNLSCRYLSDQHDATTIGVLLGMSACCRSTADTTVARMLFLHLPARHPNTFPEIELSPHVQVCATLLQQHWSLLDICTSLLFAVMCVFVMFQSTIYNGEVSTPPALSSTTLPAY